MDQADLKVGLYDSTDLSAEAWRRREVGLYDQIVTRTITRTIDGRSKPERLCDAEKSVQRMPRGLLAPRKER